MKHPVVHFEIVGRDANDVEAALAHAEFLGGTRIMGPEEPAPDAVIGLFTDPEGHLVGVVSGSDV